MNLEHNIKFTFIIYTYYIFSFFRTTQNEFYISLSSSNLIPKISKDEIINFLFDLVIFF